MTDGFDFFDATPTKPKRQGLSLGSWVLIAGVVLAIMALGVQLSRQNTIQPQKGDIAPDFTLTAFDGETIRLADLRGKIVVVNFWGSWCTECYGEAPDLQSIYEDYSDRDVVVIGVNWLDTPDGAQEFILRFGLTYPNAEDLQERVAKAYHITGAPENFIIDREGIVYASLIGAVNYEMVAKILDDMLAKESS